MSASASYRTPTTSETVCAGVLEAPQVGACPGPRRVACRRESSSAYTTSSSARSARSASLALPAGAETTSVRGQRQRVDQPDAGVGADVGALGGVKPGLALDDDAGRRFCDSALRDEDEPPARDRA